MRATAPRRRPLPWGVALTITAAVAAGCAEQTSDVSVRMTGALLYEPATVAVPAGSTVTWENDGVHQHTVTAIDESFEPTGTFDSGRVVGTGTFSHTFDQPGSYRYACLIHRENMVGIVEVMP